MICYASHTHNKRNLAALRGAGWRLMISRARPDGKPEGMLYALDNGAWSDFRANRDFDDDGFRTLVDRLGGSADFIIAPDIVAGGQRSLPHFPKCRLLFAKCLTRLCWPCLSSRIFSVKT